MTIDRMIEITLQAIETVKIGRGLAFGQAEQKAERDCEDTIEELNQMLGALSILAENADLELKR